MDLRSPVGVVEITTRALKIGVQSRFYPISTLGFRTFFPEKFWPGLQCGCGTELLRQKLPLLLATVGLPLRFSAPLLAGSLRTHFEALRSPRRRPD